MKKIYYILTLLCSVLLFSCEELEERDPSPVTPSGCMGVYFPTTNETVLEIEPSEPTQMTITVARNIDTVSAAEVPIVVEVNTDDVFVVPATASFAANEKTATVEVNFPNAEVGKGYTLKLAVTGDAYVNPYAATTPFLSTEVTRIKWSPMGRPLVYVDAVGGWGYGIAPFAMYVEADSTTMGTLIRYRLKNVYHITTDAPDADGIYNGYPESLIVASEYTKDWSYDDAQDNYTIIDVASNGVSMGICRTGMVYDPADGMITIGSVYGNLSTNLSEYPLGTLQGSLITFPASSLFCDIPAAGKYPLPTPTQIYLTKEAYLKDNMKIKDFNKIAIEDIPGALREFESAAYGDTWSDQSFAKAVDIDAANEASEYKNLYYLSDLYTANYGLAFYYDGDKVKIPANQPTGKTAFNKAVFVSPSDSLRSSVTVSSKGVTTYSFGLTFHFKDGTVLGEFTETFSYSEEALTWSIEDFQGSFKMSGVSVFGEPNADMDVAIDAGTSPNSLVITGIKYADTVMATFNPATSTMSIAPQALPDYGPNTMELYTFDSDFNESATVPMEFAVKLNGEIVMAPTTAVVGYVIVANGEDYADGYANLVFSPQAAPKVKIAAAKSLNLAKQVSLPMGKSLRKVSVAKKTKYPQGNFSIQPKKTLRKNAIPFLQ